MPAVVVMRGNGQEEVLDAKSLAEAFPKAADREIFRKLTGSDLELKEIKKKKKKAKKAKSAAAAQEGAEDGSGSEDEAEEEEAAGKKKA